MSPAPAMIPRPFSDEPVRAVQSAWPTAAQILLLHAGLGEQRDAVIAAWDAWRDSVDFENLDYGSHRLLPLLHRNLIHHQVPAHPWFGRMKGVHRHTWVRNQRVFACIANLVREFRDELGTPVMLL